MAIASKGPEIAKALLAADKYPVQFIMDWTRSN
jgi:hypothetical protein